MPDHKSKAGKPDRSRSNRNEPYEVSDLAMKEGVSAKEVIDAIVKVGPMRKDVVAELRKKIFADFSAWRRDANLWFRFTEAGFDDFMQAQKL